MPRHMHLVPVPPELNDLEEQGVLQKIEELYLSSSRLDTLKQRLDEINEATGIDEKDAEAFQKVMEIYGRYENVYSPLFDEAAYQSHQENPAEYDSAQLQDDQELLCQFLDGAHQRGVVLSKENKMAASFVNELCKKILNVKAQRDDKQLVEKSFQEVLRGGSNILQGLEYNSWSDFVSKVGEVTSHHRGYFAQVKQAKEAKEQEMMRRAGHNVVQAPFLGNAGPEAGGAGAAPAPY